MKTNTVLLLAGAAIAIFLLRGRAAASGIALLTPANRAVLPMGFSQFRWQGRPLLPGEGWIFQVAYDSQFRNIYFNTTNTFAGQNVTWGKPEPAIFWRVGIVAGGATTWSEVRSLRVQG